MRNVLWTVLACLALGVTVPSASAQGFSANNFMTGSQAGTFSSGAAQTVVNQPIDTSNVIAPYPTQTGSSYLMSFFRSLNVPLLGGSPLPGGSYPSLSYPSGQAVPFKPLNNLSPSGYVPITPKHD